MHTHSQLNRTLFRLLKSKSMKYDQNLPRIISTHISLKKLNMKPHLWANIVRQHSAVIRLALFSQQIYAQRDRIRSIAHLHTLWLAIIAGMNGTRVWTVEVHLDVHHTRLACCRHLRHKFDRHRVICANYCVYLCLEERTTTRKKEINNDARQMCLLCGQKHNQIENYEIILDSRRGTEELSDFVISSLSNWWQFRAEEFLFNIELSKTSIFIVWCGHW